MGVALLSACAQHAAAPPADPAPQVTVATVTSGTFVERVEAQGHVGPPEGSSAKLAFPQAGTLASIDVHVGQRVATGTTLAALDSAALASGVAQAEGDAQAAAANFGGGSVPGAAVASARAKLALAEEHLRVLERGGPAATADRIAAASAARQAQIKDDADRATLARTQTLVRAGVLADKDLEAARAQLAADDADLRAADAKLAQAGAGFQASVTSARADVASARGEVAAAGAQAGALGGASRAAQARLDAARIALRNGTLTAPADGTVLAILKRPGEYVDATTPVVEVGPPNDGAVTLTVPGDVAHRIAPGDRATLTMAHGASAAHGRVVSVVPAVDPLTQAATVVVRGAPRSAVAGDAVNATIDVARVAGPLVPSTAIVQDPQTGKTVVFVRTTSSKEGEPAFELRDVVVRASDAATAVLASGVRPGERIATQGAYTLLAPGGG